MARLLKEVTQGAYAYEPVTLEDVKRAAQVDKKFAGLGLGIVDSSIVAMAERLDVRRILTIDADSLLLPALRVGRQLRFPPCHLFGELAGHVGVLGG
jgi:hypothetical protein